MQKYSEFHFAQDLRFFSKIPDSYWDSKRFVLDSSWCRTPRTSIPQGARPQLTLVSYGSWIEYSKVLWTFLSKNCLNDMKFSINLKASGGLEVELNVEWNHYPPKLTDLLNRILNSLPSWSLLRGTNISLPILYIDEANLLRELVIKDVNG